MDDVKQNFRKFSNATGENQRRRCAKMGLTLWLKQKWLVVAQATPAIEVVLVAARGSSQWPVKSSPTTHTYTFSDLYLFQPPTTPWACLQASFTFTSLLIIYCAHLSSNHSFAKSRRSSRAFFTRIPGRIEIGLAWPILTGLVERKGYAF